jgi:translation initiation factor IF-2
MAGKATRLNKIARQFNVGISTMVEFLQKKGIEIEANPNTKIEPDVYSLLAKEYDKDSQLKEESEKIELRNNRIKKEAVSVDEENESQENQTGDEQTEVDEVMVKDLSSHKPSAKEKEEIIKTPSETEEKPKLKVVGKVDLEKKPEPVAPKEEKAPVKEKPEEIKDKVVVKAEEPVKEEAAPVVEQKKEVAPEKTENKPAEKPADIKEEGKPKKTEKPAPKVEKKADKQKAEEKPVKAEKAEKKEEKEPPKEETEHIKTSVEQLDDVKVVGKIDLSTLNQKTRPAKKSKEEREKERKERHGQRKGAQKVASTDGRDGDKDKDFIERKRQKLSGPTVVGKIDLPDGQKKGDQNASDDAKKKKRKRIRKDKVDVNKNNQPNQQNRNDRGPKKKGPQKGGKRVIKKEVSDEDVQKQIKDTLARLTAPKGKNKGAKYRKDKRDTQSQRVQEELEKQELEKNILKVTEFVSVAELANMMSVPVNDVIGTCMNLGLFVSINQRLDAETMALVADEFSFKVEFVSADVLEAITEDEDVEEDLQDRPPIITVMGHVDHGKTSLLDYIRRANVIAGEAGGITQHIGAYAVKLEDGRKICFLDTPGHEAFTAMRARGAQVTDLAIIIVAADDNIMPQTVEAINHAQAAGVPIVFAINKIDKPGANPDKIKEALANMNLLVEEWGGKFQSQDISAKNGVNIEELLEKVMLEAEMLELKANPDKKATGTVIESTLDKGRGYVATVLVQSGTLKVGDIVLAGQYTGHVKAMYNERNQRVDEAGPSTPVLILGLNGAPQAGDKFNIMESDRDAKEIANKRQQLAREQGLRTQKHITLDEIGRRIAVGNFQELNVIVKGDVDGSIEALSDSLIKLSTDEIQVNVIHKAVGQISESDILLATASDAIICGFQVRPSMAARKLAEKEEIDIRLYSVIYDAINEVRDAMEGMLSPEVKEEIVASVEVRETFKISKVGTIAGCFVRDGKIKRSHNVRVIRDGIVVYTGLLGSLKRFKDDVKEVNSGYECGLNIDKYNDVKVGDIVEAYEEVEVKRTL